MVLIDALITWQRVPIIIRRNNFIANLLILSITSNPVILGRGAPGGEVENVDSLT